MQKLIPLQNDDFSVPPPSTISHTIISKRQIKFPINTPTTYSHPKNTQYPYTIYTDFGDNENIVDLMNTHLEFDFKGMWHSPESSHAPILTPNFDQSTQALISRWRIGTSQGMEIEQVTGYNRLSNIVQAYTSSTTSKDFHLTNQSKHIKTAISASHGHSDSVGDCIYGPTMSSGPEHNVEKRLELRFTNSSFLNRVKMLPLFLFRNGMRIEADFEDVNKAFVYESTANGSLSNGINLVPQIITASSIVDTTPMVNWWVGPGTIDPLGNIRPTNPVPGAAGFQILTRPTGTPYYPCHYYYGPNSNQLSADTYMSSNSNFSRWQNTLYLDVQKFSNHIHALPTSNISNTQHERRDKLFLGVPVNIYEGGKLKFRGFIPIPYSVAGKAEIFQTNGFNENLRPTNAVGVQTSDRQGGVLGWSRFYQRGENANPGLFSNGNLYWPIPLYGWDHNEGNAADSVPYKYFDEGTDEIVNGNRFSDYVRNMKTLDASIHIDWDNFFLFSAEPNSATRSNDWNPTRQSYRDPRALTIMEDDVANYSLGWDYTITNIEWRMTLIKPSSDVFTQYTTAFQKDIGIPYPYTRIFQFSRIIPGPVTGQQQLQIPISVRSLNSMLVVFGDPYFETYTTGDSQRFFVPMLSTFQRRGLSRIELTVGGTVKPEYRVQMDPKEGMEHIPLVENFFGVDGMTSFNPSFHRSALGQHRNLLASGRLGLTGNQCYQAYQQRTFPTAANSKGVPTSVQTLDYTDSSKFVWGINLAKRDTRGFASGLDTTMSGSVILNCYFANDAAPTKSNETYDPGYHLGRNVQVWIYCMADALFTAQNDANLVRW